MSLTVGIIGLPNVGKSTLINALAQAGAEASNYPFCTIECNRGVVQVPDERLKVLEGILHPKEVLPSHITYVDIAGLVEGASRGEGLGNKFLHHVREADLLAHVLRCFEDPDVSHVFGSVDPLRDLEIIDTELRLADIDRIDKWISKETTRLRAAKKTERKELDILESLKEHISEGRKLPDTFSGDLQKKILGELDLLSLKPVIAVLNAGEGQDDAFGRYAGPVIERLGEGRVIGISAKLEDELSLLSEEERAVFIEEMGVEGGAKGRFVEKCHGLLGLIRYYTAANDKLQAWSIPSGTKAPAAAGAIHSDMEKGFIRAKVMSFEDLSSLGSVAEVQHHGRLRTEGHDYVVRDGDVIEYLFGR